MSTSTGKTPWNPTQILATIKPFDTNSATVRVATNQGDGYLKVLSEKSGPHGLAAELIGTLLARRIGLQTLDFHLITVTSDDPIELFGGRRHIPGPAYITRAEQGMSWDETRATLDRLDNPEDIAKLIVFDTWTRNCDRHMPRPEGKSRKNVDNVFISFTKGHYILKAIDQGCCFTCDKEITIAISNIEFVRDDTLYGNLSGFENYATRMELLEIAIAVESITKEELSQIIDRVPAEWQLTTQVRSALRDFLHQRGQYIRAIVNNQWPLSSLFD